MDWVVDHLQVLIVIAAAALALLQKFKGARAPGPGTAPAAEDPAQAERTRRIQEEIRRRIMERRGQVPGLPAESGPAAAEPTPFPAAPPVLEEVSPARVPPNAPQVIVAPAENTREWERQQALLEEMRVLEKSRPVPASAASLPILPAPAEMPVPGRTGSWLADLRHPAALRRAVVLREILGPPVGLQ